MIRGNSLVIGERKWDTPRDGPSSVITHICCFPHLPSQHLTPSNIHIKAKAKRNRIIEISRCHAIEPGGGGQSIQPAAVL